MEYDASQRTSINTSSFPLYTRLLTTSAQINQTELRTWKTNRWLVSLLPHQWKQNRVPALMLCPSAVRSSSSADAAVPSPGRRRSCHRGRPPPPQGLGTLRASKPWISLTPASGSAAATIGVGPPQKEARGGRAVLLPAHSAARRLEETSLLLWRRNWRNPEPGRWSCHAGIPSGVSAAAEVRGAGAGVLGRGGHRGAAAARPAVFGAAQLSAAAPGGAAAAAGWRFPRRPGAGRAGRWSVPAGRGRGAAPGGAARVSLRLVYHLPGVSELSFWPAARRRHRRGGSRFKRELPPPRLGCLPTRRNYLTQKVKEDPPSSRLPLFGRGSGDTVAVKGPEASRRNGAAAGEPLHFEGLRLYRGVCSGLGARRPRFPGTTHFADSVPGSPGQVRLLGGAGARCVWTRVCACVCADT